MIFGARFKYLAASMQLSKAKEVLNTAELLLIGYQYKGN